MLGKRSPYRKKPFICDARTGKSEEKTELDVSLRLGRGGLYDG